MTLLLRAPLSLALTTGLSVALLAGLGSVLAPPETALGGSPVDDPVLPPDTLPDPLPLERPFGLQEAFAPQPALAPAEVALGRRLFFDPILSLDRTVSCASCHQPEFGFADPRPFSVGIGGQLTTRNAPALLNRGLGSAFMWDGRAESLAHQVVMPMANTSEMGLGIERAVERLIADDAWASAFAEGTGEGPSRDSVTRCLVAFISALTWGDSPVDRFRAGEVSQLSGAAKSGLWIYESKGRCWRCHSGPNFTDEAFHNTGVGVRDRVAEEGRFAVTGEEADRGRFKTPTLRGLARTGPYMHDGSLATLAEVVDYYRRGGGPNPGLSEHIAPFEMSDADAANLIAFLEALSEHASGPPPAPLR